MRFSVHILGSGSAAPTLGRRPSAQVVNIREHQFLVDCGEGTQIQIRKQKIKFQKIKHIFISHMHGDHVFGLMGLISTYHLLGRTQELNIYGPVGLKEFVETQLRLTESYLNYHINFTEVDPCNHEMVLETTVCKVFTIPLKHRIACCGYLFVEKENNRKILPEKMAEYDVPMVYASKIKQGGDGVSANGEVIDGNLLSSVGRPSRSYAYCSDTAYHEDIIPIISGVDLLYHESTFKHDLLDRAKKTYHSTSLQAGQIAKLAGVKRLLIGHFSARYNDVQPLVDEARTVFEDTISANDGLLVDIT